MKHPQEQVLRTADRAPMGPRDLGGPALDPVIMRSRRQRPVKSLPHGHMIGTAHLAQPIISRPSAPPPEAHTRKHGRSVNCKQLPAQQYPSLPVPAPDLDRRRGSSANSRARQTATPGDRLGLPALGRACRHRRAPARTVPGQPRTGGGRPGGVSMRLWAVLAPRRAQQSNTDQQMSFRNRWSSSTSSRIASGSWSRCHWHSSRPAPSPSPSGAPARAALIA